MHPCVGTLAFNLYCQKELMGQYKKSVQSTPPVLPTQKMNNIEWQFFGNEYHDYHCNEISKMNSLPIQGYCVPSTCTF